MRSRFYAAHLNQTVIEASSDVDRDHE
jgi:hypothetical protein